MFRKFDQTAKKSYWWFNDHPVDTFKQHVWMNPFWEDGVPPGVRTLDGSTLSLTGHIRVETEDLHEAQEVTNRLSAALAEVGVGHVTLQSECHPCEDPGR